MWWHFMAEISFDPAEPVIVLNVTIEGLKGKKKISAAVDAGATFTIIPWGVADVLGYKPYYPEKELELSLLAELSMHSNNS